MSEKVELAFKVNLNNLKRLDPLVVDILARASHVVVYCYDQESRSWVGLVLTIFFNNRLKFLFLGKAKH